MTGLAFFFYSSSSWNGVIIKYGAIILLLLLASMEDGVWAELPPPQASALAASTKASVTNLPPRGGILLAAKKTKELSIIEQDASLAAANALKEYKTEASSLFGNLRIPASLFAGASAGAAFALPVAHGVEPLKVGLVKRLYALLMMGALSSEIVAVVIATLAVATIATKKCPPTSSVEELLSTQFALEWVSARFHFLTGLLMFSIGIGVRAWISIACPIIAKAALGIVLSGATLCVAFIQEMESSSTFLSCDGLVKLPFQYFQLMLQQSTRKKRPLFAIAFVISLTTSIYVASNIPHIVHFLTTQQTT